MANDRVHIKCKYCGGWKMLLKHFPPFGPKTRDNGILDWLDTHANCNPNKYELDLKGDPGFALITESDNTSAGLSLDPDKQNMKGAE